jgi:CheY-like chemotaxis protein/HPt (histidine-containing phosphotransfer) domain-containing protein
VELMGGHIDVKSEYGHGSTFQFTLPMMLGEPRSANESQDSPAVRDLSALIVDDNATNRRILEETLRNWGMRPTAVESGEAALQILQQARALGEPFGLVMLDVHMPGMDGFELAEHIQQQPQLAGATLMMLTSGGRPGDSQRCRDLGVRSYLTKPVRQAELRRSVLQALGRHEAAPALPAAPAISSTQGLRVLVAEDNVINQKLAQRLLEKHGHKVLIARHGREVLEIWHREPVDLILMDVQMPEMDGLEATARIRSREIRTGQHVPIIAMTAYAMKGDREICLEAGMDGYVSKPIHSEELLAAIARLGDARGERLDLEPSGDGATLVDWSAALAFVGGDKGLLRELARLFLSEGPLHLAHLQAALDQNDPDALRLAAHPLKNCLNLLGAGTAADLALELEKLGRTQDLAGGEALCQSLSTTMADLLPQVRAFSESPV